MEGRRAEAARSFSRALALDPTMQPAHDMLAQLTAPATPQGERSIVARQPANPAPAMAVANDSILPTPEAVAKFAVKGLFAGKNEIIPGVTNSVSALLTRFVPKALTEKIAAGLYEV